MSKQKAFLPGTYVLGSSPVLDHDKMGRLISVRASNTMSNVGHGDVPYAKRGDPIWRKPKPAQFVQHFRTAAAKRMVVNEVSKKLGVHPSQVTIEQALRAASPKHLKIVPIYRGVTARFACEIRAAKRRQKRIAAQQKKSLASRTLESLGLAGAQTGAALSPG